jgi:uncharacterized UBP type Zn finger protein
MRYITPVRLYFQNTEWIYHANPANKYSPMLNGISEFFNAIWRSDLSINTKIAPGRFYQTLTEIASKVGYDDLAVKHRQADAGEALLFMLDSLHEGLAHPVEMVVTGIATTPEERRWTKSYEQWIQHYKKQWSVVIKTLHGQKMTATTCKTCQYHSERFESWGSLSLPIVNGDKPGTPAPTLNECLEDYFKEEILEDYHCDVCGKKREAVQTIMEQKIKVLVQGIAISASSVLQSGYPVTGQVAVAANALTKDVAALQRLVNASIAALRNAASNNPGVGGAPDPYPSSHSSSASSSSLSISTSSSSSGAGSRPSPARAPPPPPYFAINQNGR